jgi:hypothetical protein
MPRGGHRPGAGRPKGSKSGPSQKTLARLKLAATVAAGDVTPLQVMLETMRALWQQGEQMAACAIARDAAPYLHPRLATTNITGDGEGLIIRIVKFAELDAVRVIDEKADAVH